MVGAIREGLAPGSDPRWLQRSFAGTATLLLALESRILGLHAVSRRDRLSGPPIRFGNSRRTAVRPATIALRLRLLHQWPHEHLGLFLLSYSPGYLRCCGHSLRPACVLRPGAVSGSRALPTRPSW